MRKKIQQNPAINLQKWITKTAKKLTKRQNKTSSAAKSTASYTKILNLTAKKAFSLKFRHSSLCKFRKLNTL